MNYWFRGWLSRFIFVSLLMKVILMLLIFFLLSSDYFYIYSEINKPEINLYHHKSLISYKNYLAKSELDLNTISQKSSNYIIKLIDLPFLLTNLSFKSNLDFLHFFQLTKFFISPNTLNNTSKSYCMVYFKKTYSPSIILFHFPLTLFLFMISSISLFLNCNGWFCGKNVRNNTIIIFYPLSFIFTYVIYESLLSKINYLNFFWHKSKNFLQAKVKNSLN